MIRGSLLLTFFILCIFYEGFAQRIINSFENEKDLEKIHVTAGVHFSRSAEFPALQAYSCKVVFPENGGTFYQENKGAVFHRNIEASGSDVQEALQCFIWTGDPAEAELVLEDSAGNTFSEKYFLKRGANHLQMKLPEAKGIDSGRIKSVGIRTRQAHVFYIDYLALDHYQHVLEKYGRYDVPYSTNVETTHYEWGSGLAGGAIESYSISPVFDGRGIIELAERLSLDFRVTTIGRTYGAEKYGFGDFYRRRSPGYSGDGTTYNLVHDYIAADLMYGPESDVIIWPGIHKWESYPLTIRDAIRKRVRNGAGLVLLFPESDQSESGLWELSPLKSEMTAGAQKKINDREMFSMPSQLDRSKWKKKQPHYITRGLALDAMPWGSMGVFPYKKVGGGVLMETSQGNPVLAVSKYGKGRVVAFAYPERGFLPRMHDPWETGLHYPYWEYMWSMVARAVVWAAGREPSTNIYSLNYTGQGISAELVNVPARTSMHFVVRDEYGVVEEEINMPVKKNQARLNVEFKNNLHGGRHIVNARLTGVNGVFDWYSLVFQTDKPAEIISVKNEKIQVPLGEKVCTQVVLKSKEPVTGVLNARLFDNYGRLVDQQTREVTVDGGKSLNFEFVSGNILTHQATIDLTLNVNGSQADRKSEEVFLLLPRIWDDYDITMYHFGPNPVPGTWEAVDRQLQNLDVTTLAAYTLETSKHANYKVQAQTRIHGVESPDRGPDLEYYEKMLHKYLETHDKYILKRKYGLKEPSYLDSVRSELTSMIGEWKKFSPSAYYIYEEPSVTRYDGALDLCFRESTLKAMRAWLKEAYGSLQALNEQWGTRFTQWDDVIPDDTYEARERGNYSSWADHRTFMEICWADQFKYVRDIVNQVDPGGLVQLSGTQATSSHNGYDYSRFDKYVGQMNPYDIDNQLEYHHTFNPDLKISGQAGYGALGKGVIYDYYHHLFLKETGGAYIFWQVSSLNPDLRMCEAGRIMKEGMDEMLKRGIGRLISSYDPENEMKIAIHFSYPSIHAAWIVDGEIVPQTGDNDSETLKEYNRDRDGWVKVLHDMGVGFDFIAYSSIENGGLDQYKVFILPMSYAISDKEVEEIKKFVENGGILIADALPGVMDDHAKFRPERALADVFGINARAYKREELIIPQCETDLKTKKARVLSIKGKKREILYNQFGKGKAYLLNYFMETYPAEKAAGTNEAALQRIIDVFERENLKSSVCFTDESGNSDRRVEIYSFSEPGNSARLLGLLPGRQGNNRLVKLHLGETVHLYDVRDGKFLGKGKAFDLRVEPSVPGLYALVKDEVTTLDIKGVSGKKLGDEVKLNLNIINGKGISGLRSVVRVNVYDPTGKYLNYYSRNCDIVNGKGTFTFRTALNDIPGPWKIRTFETITGLEKEIIIDIQ